MYNTFAYVALIGWIPVSILLFARLRPPIAVTVVFLGSFLLLPATLAIDFPGLPAIDRHLAGGIGALLGYLFFVPERSRSPYHARWPLFLIAASSIGVFVTSLLNSDPIVRGSNYLPGLRLYDGLGELVRVLGNVGVPFYLGMRLIRNIDDLADVLRVVVVAGLACLLIVVWENRMSPQLHAQLYGVFPHSFFQHIRAGGFRPLGFTIHGLELALFMATAVLATAGLARARMRMLGVEAKWLLLPLLCGLIFCRSLGPIIYGVFFPALLFLTGSKLQTRLIAVLAAMVMLYPLARTTGLIPVDAIVSAATEVSEERGQSIETRFRNENLLLKKFAERPYFGWGGWGRSLLYEEGTGRSETVTDGLWIGQLGAYGLAGFLSFFGMLTAAAHLAASAWRRQSNGLARIVLLTAVLMLLMRVVDFLPNAFPVPFTPFLAGALMAFTALRPPQVRQRAASTAVGTADASSLDIVQRSPRAQGDS